FIVPYIASHFKFPGILQKQNLTCAQVFGGPAENVLSEWDKIWGILKSVCDIHDLPLAQTWAVIPFTTFVSHETVIKKSCCSFDTKCIRKTCMSTVSLPFYVRDLSMCVFQNECREQHLDSSHSLVGKALLSHGSCFCEDVTKLSKEEYPLVHNARMSRLTSCFLIFLHSVERKDDYVLEFFLPYHTVDVSYVVQTLKQIIEDGSGFVLGDTSPMDFSDISADSESVVTDVSESDYAIVPDTGSSADATMDKTWGASNPSKHGIKRKIESDTITVKVTYEGYMTNLHFPISLGLLELEKKVTERFKLHGKSLRLKYTDEDDDLILIVCDADLEPALVTPGSNSISLICLTD
ncbi:NIN-like protein, partial [Tanacetum coccineum]